MDDPAVEKKKKKKKKQQQQQDVLFPDVPRRKRTLARRAGPGAPDRRCSPQLPSPSSAPGGVFPYLAVPRRKRTPSASSPIPSPSGTDCSSITRWPLFRESIPLSEYRIPGEMLDFAEEVFSVGDLVEFLALDGLDGEEPPALCLFLEALSDYVIPGPLPDLEDEDYVHQGFSNFEDVASSYSEDLGPLPPERGRRGPSTTGETCSAPSSGPTPASSPATACRWGSRSFCQRNLSGSSSSSDASLTTRFPVSSSRATGLVKLDSI